MITGIVKRLIQPAMEAALVAHADKREAEYKSIERLRGLVVEAGLRHLFKRDYFDICQLESCVKAASIVPDGETMRLLRPLHCMDYADMKPELRELVFVKVMNMFKVAA